MHHSARAAAHLGAAAADDAGQCIRQGPQARHTLLKRVEQRQRPRLLQARQRVPQRRFDQARLPDAPHVLTTFEHTHISKQLPAGGHQDRFEAASLSLRGRDDIAFALK